MLDSIRIIANVGDINNFKVLDQLDIRQGTAGIDFYIQLYQKDIGARYIPSNTAIVTLTFPRIVNLRPSASDLQVFTQGPWVEESQDVVKNMTSPYATDRSIWKTTLTADDVGQITTGGIFVTVTEGSKVTTASGPNAIRKLLSNGSTSSC